MKFFELEASDISALDDGDLRELVARLCEAELIQQGLPPSVVTWGGAQEAADGGLDVIVRSSQVIPHPNFIPGENTGFQVKKHSMGKSACKKEMEEKGALKAIIKDLATLKGAYIIVSGKDDCSEKMLRDRLHGMQEAVSLLREKKDLRLDFYGRDRLLNWLRQHPSVALWVRSRLGKPLAGWEPYGRWAATPLLQDDEFLVDDHPCVIDANSGSKEPMSASIGIQLTRDRLRKRGSTVRITGLSGVGKTRFAQALFETGVGRDALPASDVIYADLGCDLTPTASELVAYLMAKDFSTYLVLDNCPPDVHRNLQKQVAKNGAKLHLLTIEYDISDDRPEETDVIHLEPTSEATVSRLVQKRFPDLGRVNADRVAEFSGGNSRVALALASRVNSEETLASFSDEDLFRRLFIQRKESSSDLLQSAEVLSLVYSFNVARSESNDELSVLDAISGVERKVLHRGQAELFRRKLIQQRGSWRAILPHALANRLAKRALESISPEDINAELFKAENLRLLQSCAHRMGYLHDFEPAQKLALTWVQSGGPLHNIAFCSDQHLLVLEYVAPVFPDLVLQLIEQASATPGFASRDNGNFIRFVRLLCHLAYEDESFEQAVEILLKFAETEEVDEKHDSIVGYMRQLFSLHLSGTEATPERRQNFIQRLLGAETPRYREIARKFLDSAFEANHWSSTTSFYFGARKRGAGWHPKSYSEEVAWYVGHIRLLEPMLSSSREEDSAWAKSLLKDHFHSLWSIGGCLDILEELIQTHGCNGGWPEIWIVIKRTIHLDGVGYAPEILAKLERLERMTSPSDPYSEIRAFALVDTWMHAEIGGGNFVENTRKINAKITQLGIFAASNLDCLDRLGTELWMVRSNSAWLFGRGIAAGSSNWIAIFDMLVASFQIHRREQASLNPILGYINGIYDASPAQAREIIERALDVPFLKPYAVNIICTIPIESWGTRKLQELAREGSLEAWRFEQIGYGGVHEFISDGDLAILLSNVNVLKKGYISVFEILNIRFFERDLRKYVPTESLCAVGRDAIRRLVSAHRDEFRGIRLYRVDSVFKECFDASVPEGEVKEVVALLCAGIESYRLYGFEMERIISSLLECYPELMLDRVFNGEENERLLAFMLFRDRVGRKVFTLNDVPIDRIMTWCDGDQNRLLKVASAVHVYMQESSADSSPARERCIVLSKHIKHLLNAAVDKLAVVEIIFKGVCPSSWSGSLSNIIERRSKAFADLLDYPDLEVRSLAKDKLVLLQKRIQMEREREVADSNSREQRFE
ncbi:TPA: hypothetical protein ACGJZX_002884 [Pseudomonas aeruginosa]|uniref:hypothetical protein n=1 Tax=Pseudomonas aeruginosa TaxID=287 RepID=UPI00053E3487|nr:hypothetical protein [Pseudomonas aeruginosa]